MHVENQYFGQDWTLYEGDCCEVIKAIPDGSMDLSIHSPPFANLYIYSDSKRDMGNCSNDKEFLRHYNFLVPHLYRVTRPGRLAVVHCKQLVDYTGRDGQAGMRDFRGRVIRLFQAAGFKYHSEVCIWKCPAQERDKTNAQGLLHCQLERDSSYLRQGLPDYLVIFRRWPKDGEDSLVRPIHRPEGISGYVGLEPPSEAEVADGAERMKCPPAKVRSILTWRKYASPVWFDINGTRVLKPAKTEDEEKHLCPLQLDVIERAAHLWSSPGDVVFSPFAGIGSELWGAVNQGRKAVGIELNPLYVTQAVRNLKALDEGRRQLSMLDFCRADAPRPAVQEVA